MKNAIVITIVLWSCLSGLISCGSPDRDNSNTDPGGLVKDTLSKDSILSGEMYAGLLHVMDSMMNQIVESGIPTDFDVCFSNMMVLHHQAAIDMARIEISKGRDESIKTLARIMSGKRSEEIKKLKTGLHHHKPMVLSDQKKNELTFSLNNMISKMKELKMTGHADKDFVQMMIPHLESSIEMSAQEIIQGHHVQLKLMARDMVKERGKEKDQFQKWLDSH